LLKSKKKKEEKEKNNNNKRGKYENESQPGARVHHFELLS
jgi:hypothetical protein